MDKRVKLSVIHKECGKVSLVIKRDGSEGVIFCEACQEEIKNPEKEILHEKQVKR